MTDRAMQALYLLALAPIAEATGDPNSYGFRIERSTADAMSQLFTCLSQKASGQWVLEADIEGCFDHINHHWLVANIPTDKAVLRKWLKAGVVHKGQLQATDAGTPQGGIISPTLANMVLDGLESGLKQYLGRAKAKRLKIHVVRYADDFVITGDSGGAGKRGQTLGRAVPGGTRAAVVTRENADRPHRSRLRLPGMEFPQVRREAPDQAEQEKRASVLSQGEGGDQQQQDDEAGKPDSPA